MLKIRLMRIGAKRKPFYRVVAVDERNKRDGAYIELLGTYNPLTQPKDIKLQQDRIDYWVKQGAQMSTGFLRIIGKAPQRPIRPPKKQQKEASAAAPAPVAENQPVEELASEQKTEEVSATTGEAPVEEVKSESVETTSAVESAPEVETSQESDSKPTGSETQEASPEPEISEPSGASQSDEPATQVEEEKKDEGSA